MWPFSKRFSLTAWDGKIYFLTAKQLHERVMHDSKCNKRWFISASELVRVCSQKSFPKKYVQKLKIAILNYFATLETKHEFPSHYRMEDEEAVYFCYNSLTAEELEITAAKQAYLRAIIDGVAKYHFKLIEFNHYGPTYSKLCKQWKQECFEKFYQPAIDFLQLRMDLHASFDKTMRDAEAHDAFKIDDDQRFKNINIFLTQLRRDEKGDHNG